MLNLGTLSVLLELRERTAMGWRGWEGLPGPVTWLKPTAGAGRACAGVGRKEAHWPGKHTMRNGES